MGGVKSKRTPIAIPVKPCSPTLHPSITRERPITISLVGDAQIGKTALVHRISKGAFDESGTKTFSATEGELGIPVAFSSARLPGVAHIKIFDFYHPNFNRFRVQRHSTPFRNMNVLLFMFDLERRESYQNVEKWIKEADRYYDIGDAIKMIVGTRADAVSPVVVKDVEKKVKDLEADKRALGLRLDLADPTSGKKKAAALLCLQASTALFCVKENFKSKSCINFPDEIMMLIVEKLNRAIQSIVMEYANKRADALREITDQIRYWTDKYIAAGEPEDFADQVAMPYLKVSSKTGEGIEDLVVNIVKEHSERLEYNDDL